MLRITRQDLIHKTTGELSGLFRHVQNLEREAKALEDKISGLLDRIVEAQSPSVVAAYERRIAELEKEKLEKQENAASCTKPRRDYTETFRTALQFLASPWNIWISYRIEDKRAVLKLTFPGLTEYDRKSGFRTPKMSLPFNMLEQISA